MTAPCRREVLATAGAVAGVTLAGCSSDSSSDPSGESTNELVWADWIPAAEFSEETTIVHFDIAAARDELPEDILMEFGTRGFASSLGIDRTELEEVIRLDVQSETRAAVFVAPINPDELVGQIDVQDGAVESYGEYEIITLPEQRNLALSDSDIVLAPSPNQYIDAKNGETARVLDQRDIVEEMFRRVTPAPFVGLVPGEQRAVSTDLSIEPAWSGAGIRTRSDGAPIFVSHLRFGSAGQAAAALDTLEEKSQLSDTGDSGASLSLSQDGRYVVIEIEPGQLSLELFFP